MKIPFLFVFIFCLLAKTALSKGRFEVDKIKFVTKGFKATRQYRLKICVHNSLFCEQQIDYPIQNGQVLGTIAFDQDHGSWNSYHLRVSVSILNGPTVIFADIDDKIFWNHEWIEADVRESFYSLTFRHRFVCTNGYQGITCGSRIHQVIEPLTTTPVPNIEQPILEPEKPVKPDENVTEALIKPTQASSEQNNHAEVAMSETTLPTPILPVTTPSILPTPKPRNSIIDPIYQFFDNLTFPKCRSEEFWLVVILSIFTAIAFAIVFILALSLLCSKCPPTKTEKDPETGYYFVQNLDESRLSANTILTDPDSDYTYMDSMLPTKAVIFINDYVDIV
ncbi:hypothetical protein L596_020611 [Steinernema carpocapsae]|uniref:Uncharacterized protein n=1 Tax=Steinernema carpocapsae TaxID=34508 RepID=A0A4U5MUT8_STECR|nr:hypothetical protein L596_020611 [Steinernema carpocapsae]